MLHTYSLNHPNFKGLEYVSIMSVFNEKLLVSQDELSQLFIYSKEGRHRLTISINSDDKLNDASWTPYGNIIYTSPRNYKVSVITETSDTITSCDMIAPWTLSVSSRGIIYLVDKVKGLHQSSDDGISWKFLFKSVDRLFTITYVVQVTTHHGDDFWAIERSNEDDNNVRLGKYSLARGRAIATAPTRTNIHFDETINDSLMKISSNSRLSYDGRGNIFLSDDANDVIHIFSVKGQYYNKLTTVIYANLKQRPLVVDHKNKLLYAGVMSNVGVFKLIYDDPEQYDDSQTFNN